MVAAGGAPAAMTGAELFVRCLASQGVEWVSALCGNGLNDVLAACQAAPFNPRINMNAVWVILKYIDHVGMDEPMIQAARRHLDHAEQQAPGHPRLAGLRLNLKEVESRFGIQRKSA